MERDWRYDFTLCSEPVELVAQNYDLETFFDSLITLLEPVDEEGVKITCPYCGASFARVYPDKVEKDVNAVYLDENDEYFTELMEMIDSLVEEGKFRTAIYAVERYGVCKKCGNDYAALKFVYPTTTNFESSDELKKFYEEAKKNSKPENYYREFDEVAFVGRRYIYKAQEIWEVETAPLSYGENIEFSCVFKILYDIIVSAE